MRIKFLATATTCGMACALTLALVGCGAAQTSESAPSEEAAQTEADETYVNEAYRDISSIDLTTPGVVIESGDYDAMSAFIDNIDDYRGRDVIIDINGEMGSSVSAHTIVVPNAERTQSIGFQFEVVGLDDDAYPDAGTPVHLRGVVRAMDNVMLTIVVPEDQFEVIEGEAAEDAQPVDEQPADAQPE